MIKHSTLVLVCCTLVCTVGAPPTLRSNKPEPQGTPENLSLLFQVVTKEIELLKKKNLWHEPVQTEAKPAPYLKQGAPLKLFPKSIVEGERLRVSSTEWNDLKEKRCLLCLSVPKNRKALLVHIVNHHKHADRQFYCKSCKVGFVREERYERHLQSIHFKRK